MRSVSKILSALLILSSVVLLVSCKSRAAAPNSKPPVKIGFLPITDHLLLGISKIRDGNNFKHLTLEPVKFSDWSTLSEAVRSGDLDGAMLLAPLAFQVKLTGAPIKLVLYAHRDGSALIVKVKENIKSVQDLRRKTIAIPHRFSTHNMLLHLYTARAGLVYGKDFKTIEMAPPDMVAALARGDIDGYIVAEPFGARAELQGTGRVLVLSGQIWKHHPDCVLVLREEFLKRNPDGAEELIQSLIQSGIFVEQNRMLAAHLGAEFLGQPEDAMVKALTEPKDRVTFYDLLPQKKELAKLQDYMADKMGLFPVKVNMDDLVDAGYAEKAYAQLGSQSRALEYQPRR